MDKHFESYRREYSKLSLTRKDMPANPFDKVNQWLREAVEGNALEPTAVIVATSTPDGHPSMRTVLLKECSTMSLFFTATTRAVRGGR